MDTEKNKVIGGTLYLVATPIGNLADLSARACKVLSEVDFIAAEDTRNTAKLLAAYEITRPLISYYEHNKRTKGAQIIERLRGGQSCALVSDAGTPGISDPGEDLVRECIEADIPVTVVPGCCAAISALTLSGLSCGRFAFEGFLSGTNADKRARLEKVALDDRTLIFYEAPHRLIDTLELMYSVLGERKIAVVKEITKRNERVLHTALSRAADYYKENEPKGEYVLIVEGAGKEQVMAQAFFADMSVAEHVAFYEKSGMSRMEAMKAAAKDRGVGKSAIYKEMLENGEG